MCCSNQNPMIVLGCVYPEERCIQLEVTYVFRAYHSL